MPAHRARRAPCRPGYDDLDVPGVRSGLEHAGPERMGSVLAYERAHKNRAGVVLAAQQQPVEREHP
jgi:hypothetical protein